MFPIGPPPLPPQPIKTWYLWTLGLLIPGTFEFWNFWTLVLLISGTFDPWYLWPLELMNPGTFDPGTYELWYFWSLGLLTSPGIYEAWNLWPLDLMNHGTFKPWNFWALELMISWNLWSLELMTPGTYGCLPYRHQAMLAVINILILIQRFCASRLCSAYFCQPLPVFCVLPLSPMQGVCCNPLAFQMKHRRAQR